MKKENYLPVSDDQPTIFKTPQGANGTFDVQPFLETLEYDGADGMAIKLDDMMQDLTRLYLDFDPGDTQANQKLYTLRILRNALLKGGEFMEINQ